MEHGRDAGRRCHRRRIAVDLRLANRRSALAMLVLLLPSIQFAVAQQTIQMQGAAEREPLRYLLHVPDSKTGEQLPLVLFLHGGGEGGNDIEKVKKHGLPKLIDQGKTFPFIVVSPQNPSETQFWDDQQLIRLLDELEAKLPVDSSRIYLTGLSRGAFGVWRLAAQNPKRFAAIVPVCGGGPAPYAKRLKDTPTWVFHGAKDPVIPVEESQRMVAALRSVGNEVKFTIYPDAKHDAWTETYNNPKLYEWLLEQSRGNERALQNRADITAKSTNKSTNSETALKTSITAKRRPNVVLIMTDDQGYGDFSCHGNPILKTPHMDRLAAESIRLTDFHVAPSCTPTRGQLLTGLDALRNGANSAHGQFFLLKRGLQTMAEIFADNGYRTALYGKWHLGGNFVDFRPHERGFQDAVHFLRGGVQSHPNVWNSDLFDDRFYHNGRLEFYPGYASDIWFDLGTRFVNESLEDDEPFFLYLPLNAPHAPLLVQDAYRQPYLELDKATATFFGMIAGVDERLGRLMKFLKQQNTEQNTIVVFLTDNGTANGEHIWNAGMRGKKASLYEGGHRVPCWIRWPGGQLREPTDVRDLTHVQDLLPTLIELCQLENERQVDYDGVSLAPILHGETQPKLADRKLVVQSSHRIGEGTVMWRQWRLVRGQELFDLKSDPGQATDVSDQNPQIMNALKTHYKQWWQGVKDKLEPEPFRISGDGEITMLTAYDWWGGPRVYNWPHLRRGDQSNGQYTIRVEREGTYQISLRRWPRESGAGICESVPRYIPVDDFTAFDERLAPFPPGKSFEIVQAKVKIGNQQRSVPVQSEDQEARLEFDLKPGETTLQTWLKPKSGEEFGAYYVYIQRSDASSASQD